MHNIIFSDSEDRVNLLPFTYTRPVSELRTGILTIREKWDHYLEGTFSNFTFEHLQEKFPLLEEDTNIVIRGGLIPNRNLANRITGLAPDEAIFSDTGFLAAKTSRQGFQKIKSGDYSFLKRLEADFEYTLLTHLWQIFKYNPSEIANDFELLTEDRTSRSPGPTNTLIAPENVFFDEGAEAVCAIINASEGPVYIGKNAKIMEGAIIKGPFAIGENSTVNMGAKIYPGTTIGPWCKVGGEVNNSVFYGFSNKGHDGFLGNAVIGEWCNIGADTNNSNLKNNYEEVKIWNYGKNGFIKTGEQFCGLFLGDHSKTGINTMLNTGTVVGVSANIFGSGFPRNFIPSFSWGGASGFSTYKLEKAFETASNMMRRRNKELTDEDKNILKAVFEKSADYRKQ